MEKDRYFRLRIPQEIKDWIRSRAADSRRSMTSEIIFMLKQAMENEKADATAS